MWSLVGEMDGKRETSAHCPGSGTYLYFSSNTVSENEKFVDISTHGGAYYRCTGHRTEIRVTGGEVAEVRRIGREVVQCRGVVQYGHRIPDITQNAGDIYSI